MKPSIIKLRVEYNELEDKVWREIEILSNITWAKLGYTILAVFDTMAYHSFEIDFQDELIRFPDEEGKSKIDIRTGKLDEEEWFVGLEFSMDYDQGLTHIFNMRVVSISPLEGRTEKSYPKVTAAKGRGIMDDVEPYDLRKIILDFENFGRTDAPIYYKDEEKEWRYDDCSILFDDEWLHGEIARIEKAYQNINFNNFS